jgi:hypothetical protein
MYSAMPHQRCKLCERVVNSFEPRLILVLRVITPRALASRLAHPLLNDVSGRRTADCGRAEKKKKDPWRSYDEVTCSSRHYYGTCNRESPCQSVFDMSFSVYCFILRAHVTLRRYILLAFKVVDELHRGLQDMMVSNPSKI